MINADFCNKEYQKDRNLNPVYSFQYVHLVIEKQYSNGKI